MNTKPTCCAVGCTNAAEVQINDDYMCLHCAHPDLSDEHIAAIREGKTDAYHWCEVHKQPTGEGDHCAECERLAEEHVARMDALMNTYQYSLWVMPTTGNLFKVPVQNFNEAKNIYYSLQHECVTSVRIARFDPIEGCESVLHKFK